MKAPQKVQENIPQNYDVWEFDEIVFVSEVDASEYDCTPVGILREDWDRNMEEHDGQIYPWFSELGGHDVFVMINEDMWKAYKDGNVRQPDSYGYEMDIVQHWEDGNRERIVKDLSVIDGFLYDLEGKAVERPIHDVLYSDRYDVKACLAYGRHQHPECFYGVDIYETTWIDRKTYDAKRKLIAYYRLTDEEFQQYAKDLIEGDYFGVERAIRDRHFEQFKREEEEK